LPHIRLRSQSHLSPWRALQLVQFPSPHAFTHFYQIYSAIEEYKTGESIPLQFKEAQYIAVYQELIETWAAFAAANEARSTAVLATINTAVLYVSILISLQADAKTPTAAEVATLFQIPVTRSSYLLLQDSAL